MTPAQTVALGLLLVAVPHAAVATPDPVHKTRRAAPAHTAHSAPDITGTIAQPERTPVAGDDVIPPPFKLPAASRDRVRACGLAWHGMKLAGKTGDDDWRDFAEKCFVAKDPPVISP